MYSVRSVYSVLRCALYCGALCTAMRSVLRCALYCGALCAAVRSVLRCALYCGALCTAVRSVLRCASYTLYCGAHVLCLIVLCHMIIIMPSKS